MDIGAEGLKGKDKNIVINSDSVRFKRKSRLNPKLLIIFAVLFVIVSALIIGLALPLNETALETDQLEAIAELDRLKGTYNESHIVLENVSESRVIVLAKALEAEYRVNERGNFAVLYLSDGQTIRDVYENDDYRKYLNKMSVDTYVNLTDVEEVEDEQLPDNTLPVMRPEGTFNDPDYEMQTYLDYLNIGSTWNTTKGARVTVAIIDTGIDTDHPEFAGKISNLSYNASSDKRVCDYSDDWSLIEDRVGHGTNVAGVIAANAGNAEGIVGLAPMVTLLVIKVDTTEAGAMNTSDIVFGLYYAIECDVNVVNMSFGGYGDTSLDEPVRLAYDSDIICVAAGGNESTAFYSYPAAFEHTISVGALKANSYELADYSNYGDNTDLVAPGTVYTTAIGGTYKISHGTSFAAPVVTGGIALYLSQNKYQTFKQVTEILYASCSDLGLPGNDYYYGYGAFDIYSFLFGERGKVTFNMLTDELDNIEKVFIRGKNLQDLPEPERLYSVFDSWYYDEHYI